MSSQGNDGADKNLGDIVVEVSEKASLLVREEIELAKAEVTTKVKTLARGAAVGVAAGFFLALAAIYFLHALAYFFQDLLDSPVWLGYLIVVLVLVGLGVVAGLLAKRWLGAGPPTPDLAIKEAKLTRQTLESQRVERDQLSRSRERSGKPGNH
ncbi:MAG: phage holin family protein [Thermoleophilaceae bacterium]